MQPSSRRIGFVLTAAASSVCILGGCAGASRPFASTGGESDAETHDAAKNPDLPADAAPPVADAAPRCESSDAAAPKSDPGYRVSVGASKNGSIPFPSASQPWTLEYRFETPPLPCSSTWSHRTQAFYVWGDVDFDSYGTNGTTPVSHYRFNQIVPQVMTGWVLSGSDATYAPSWTKIDHWVIQAQYFWKDDKNALYDQTGEMIAVDPGDELVTKIAYEPDSGVIVASIASKAGTSSITIGRPFPNETPGPFASWREFFEKAELASGKALVGRPMLNIESHYPDAATVCSLAPFAIDQIELPGIAPVKKSFQIGTRGGLSCPGQSLVDLSL